MLLLVVDDLSIDLDLKEREKGEHSDEILVLVVVQTPQERSPILFLEVKYLLKV